MKSTDVVDLILIDHKTLKSCIETLTSEDAQKRTKLTAAKKFLAVLKPHSEAENNAVYATLENNKELRSHILEGRVEHGIADEKIQLLTSKVRSASSLSEELEAELKVLAELVEHHIKEEESEMLPKIRSELEDTEMAAITLMFADFRNFSKSELKQGPNLSDELKLWLKSDALLAKNYAKRAGRTLKSMKVI